jgi:hypothetical protein
MIPAKTGIRKFRVCLFLLILLVSVGCVEEETMLGLELVTSSDTPVDHGGMGLAEVLAKREALTGREVKVFGKVKAGLAFEFVSEQPYLLENGGVRLWVVTSGLAPEDGSWVTVHGTLMSPYQLKGRHYEVVLVEKTRMQ